MCSIPSSIHSIGGVLSGRLFRQEGMMKLDQGVEKASVAALTTALKSFSARDLLTTLVAGNATIDLLIPLVLLQALALGVHSWHVMAAKKQQKVLDEKVAEESD